MWMFHSSCPVALPIWPNFHQPNQELADSERPKSKSTQPRYETCLLTESLCTEVALFLFCFHNLADSFQRKRPKLNDEAENYIDAPNALEVLADTNSAEESITQQRWKVKVLIEGRTLLIPIQSPESNIQWLGSEVAKRFSDRCGKKIDKLCFLSFFSC